MAGQGTTQPADGEGLLGTGEEAGRGASDVCGRGDWWAWTRGTECQGHARTPRGHTVHPMHSSLLTQPWGFLVNFMASKILLGFAKLALPTLKIYVS